jgi:hypothetical protein
MFEEQVDSPTQINLVYDDVERHYHVIVNITGAMAKKYYVMHVTNRARVKPHIVVTSHAVTVWRAPVRLLLRQNSLRRV